MIKSPNYIVAVIKGGEKHPIEVKATDVDSDTLKSIMNYGIRRYFCGYDTGLELLEWDVASTKFGARRLRNKLGKKYIPDFDSKERKGVTYFLHEPYPDSISHWWEKEFF